MAYGGSQSWDLLCPVCKTFIETNNDDDLQATLDYHYLNVHPTLRNILQSNGQVPVLKDMKYINEKNTHQPRKECTNYIICPVCDSVVEIFQNNINHCFMEHFEMYHENIADLDAADNLSVQGRSGHSTEISVNSNKNKDNSSYLPSTSKSQPHYLFLPPELEKHSSYITLNKNNSQCHICRETLNTQQIMEDHLKTKRHEDNVIIWLREKLPNHMIGAMEFVSFYGSNLCCNLCKCKIDSNSNNPHETLLNIISHNTDAKHSQKKSDRDMRQCNVGYNILNSVAEKNPLINEHRAFIETEMEPNFKCKLCGKTIIYSKNYLELEKNFVAHLKSLLHSKNSKAMTVLQYFKEMNGDRDGRHSFMVLNGCINCTQCKCTVTADVEQLLEHCQSYKNIEISQLSKSKECAPSSSNKTFMTKKDNSSPRKNAVTKMTRPTSSDPQLNPSQIVRPKMNNTGGIKKPDVKEILHPLHNQFGNITCIAENEDGNLTCLICNLSIQPRTHCVKMHILGKFHKNKRQCQIKELNTLNENTSEAFRELNLNSEETPRETFKDLMEHLFQSLPQRFQDEKGFFKINLADGSIDCMLCNCIIDPIFLEVHLHEEEHQLKKQVKVA